MISLTLKFVVLIIFVLCCRSCFSLDEVLELTNIIKHVVEDISSLKNRFLDLENEIKMKDKKILNLENKLTLCENQSTVNNLEKKLTLRENQSTVKNIEKNPTLRENQSTVKEGLEKRDISSNVAFYARLSQDVTLGKHSTVIFDSEITNYGGGYHSFDGIFICPRSGVYLFTTTILVHSGQWIRAFIVVNGSPVAESIVHSEGGYESGSTTVIVHLQNNDHVYVRTQDDSDWVLRASVTSFAGVLLF